MPATVSADPLGLLRFVEGAAALDHGLTAEARALGPALDRVISTCELAAVPRPDHDVFELTTLAADVAAAAKSVAARFLLADRGILRAGPSALGLAIGRDASSSGDPAGLIDHLRRSPVTLTADDLANTGRWLAGMIEDVGSVAQGTSAAWTYLSPAAGWLKILTGHTPAERLARNPVVERLLGALHLRAASPWLQGASRGFAALSIVEDVKGLFVAGNPVTAWRREGARYLSRWARLGFDGTATACSKAPSIPTCGAAVVTGTAWAASDIYVHREPIGRWLRAGVDRPLLAAGVLRQWMGNELATIDRDADHLIDGSTDRLNAVLRDLERTPGLVRLPHPVVSGAEELVERARRQAHAVKDTAVTTGETLVDGASNALAGAADLLRGPR